MHKPRLPNRIPDNLEVGTKAAYSRTFTEADVALFIGVNWDINPLHTDDEYVSATPFKQRILPGLLTASMLTHIGGLWAFVAKEMELEFVAPIFIGDTITAHAEIIEMDQEKAWILLGCHCTNQQGVEVLRARIGRIPWNFRKLGVMSMKMPTASRGVLWLFSIDL